MKTRTLLTADDFFALPDDGKRYEVLAGELYVNPPPAFPTQRAASPGCLFGWASSRSSALPGRSGDPRL